MQEVLFIRDAIQGDDTRLEVYGAFPVKDALKADGYKFDAERKAWCKAVARDGKVQYDELIKIFKAASTAGVDIVAGSLVEWIFGKYGVGPCQTEAKRPYALSRTADVFSITALSAAMKARRTEKAQAEEKPEVAAARAEFEKAQASAQYDHYGVGEFSAPVNPELGRGNVQLGQMTFVVMDEQHLEWEGKYGTGRGNQAQAFAAYCKALGVAS